MKRNPAELFQEHLAKYKTGSVCSESSLLCTFFISRTPTYKTGSVGSESSLLCTFFA